MFCLEKALIPKPQVVEDRGEIIQIASFGQKGPYIKIEGWDARVQEGAALIAGKLQELAVCTAVFAENSSNGYVITIKADPEDPIFAGSDKISGYAKKEAYYVETSEKEAMLVGYDTAGAFYAAVTFAAMLHMCGDRVCVPSAGIYDAPDFERRGHFMECRYGSEFMTKENWFGVIDDMAQMKLNQLTIGVYGCWNIQYDNRRMEYLYVPLKKYPQLKTPKNIKYYSVDQDKWVHQDNILPKMFEEDYLGAVMAYGKRKNVCVKPLFNSLGHNTLLPRMTPEISARTAEGESTGCGFCTRNEKTYEVMFNVYDEIIERYLEPNGLTDIEIGLDEVGPSYICHCPKCEGESHATLMVEYIIRVCKHLKEKGMKHIYIYHDMLYNSFNIVNEELRDLFIKEGIYDEVILDWWTYEDPAHLFWDKPEGVNNLFHSIIKPMTGYYNWDIPTENNENIRACAKMAKNLQFAGMETYSSFEHCYDKNYLTLADVSWNAGQAEEEAEFNERYAYRYYPDCTQRAVAAFHSMSDIMKDETGNLYLNRVCHKFDYYFYGYRVGKDAKLKNFPGEAYRLLVDKGDEYLPYLEYLRQKSTEALKFFEGNGYHHRMNQIWTLTAKHYMTIADEYLTIYGLYTDYNRGLTDGFAVLKELDRLLNQREEVMLLAEKTRIPATAYMYLRNMTIFRQMMLDLKNYFREELAAGRKPVFNMLELDYAMSEQFRFLR